MLIETEERMFGARCGVHSHVTGLAMPAERILGVSDPVRWGRWMNPDRVDELLWAVDRQAKGGFG